MSEPTPDLPAPAPPTVDRRTVLAYGFGAAAAATLAACGTTSPPRPPSAARPTTTSPATTTGPGTTTGPTTVTTAPATSTGPTTTDDVVAAAQWAALATSLEGTLVLPSSPQYPTAVQLYDPRFDGVHPQALAYCAGPTDVQRVVGFARDHGIALAVRSGGHSYAGYSTGPGIVVDVTRMDAVTIGATSAGGTTATVGAGTRLVDLYTACNARGVSVPGGSCPTVGVAGLALGGGHGVVARAHGLTCDVVTSATVVTADGRVVTADAGTAADLWWAYRGGGGGNFGVVTSFDLATFPTTPVTRFFLSWPWAAADQVLPAYLAWAPVAPDPLWANCLLGTSPGEAAPTVEISGVWLGPPDGLSPLVASLQRQVGAATLSQVTTPDTFAHAMLVEAGCAELTPVACRLPAQGPGGVLTRQPSLARSDYLTAPLTDAGVAAVLAGIDTRRDQGGPGAVGLDSYGGAINRVAPDATAFVHRNALASVQYNADFSPGDPPAVLASAQTWLDGWYASMRPYVSGQAYQNYIDPLLADWPTAYYGANLPRLQQVKAAWDPDDVWHFAQSIPLPS